jgi:beta-glucosidase
MSTPKGALQSEGSVAFGDLEAREPLTNAEIESIARDLLAQLSLGEKITYDLWHGYRKLERDGATPAFPFGFGLGYTTFALSNLRLGRDQIETDGSLIATAEITNTGQMEGDAVVQLYVGARSSKVERAVKELKALTKVSLAPGEKRTVRLAVPAINLAYYEPANGWIVEPGDFEAIVGQHSLDDAALRAPFAVG